MTDQTAKRQQTKGGVWKTRGFRPKRGGEKGQDDVAPCPDRGYKKSAEGKMDRGGSPESTARENRKKRGGGGGGDAGGTERIAGKGYIKTEKRLPIV